MTDSCSSCFYAFTAPASAGRFAGALCCNISRPKADLSGPSYFSNSVTSITTADSGDISSTTQKGLSWKPKDRVQLTSRSTGHTIEGAVSSYSSGALVFTADGTSKSGQGPYTDWDIGPPGQPHQNNWLWPIVEDDYWCGEGADSSTQVSFSTGVTGLPQGVINPDTSAWTLASSTLTGFIGTFTSASATLYYKQSGKSVSFRGEIDITTNGTADITIKLAGLPLVANGKHSFSCYEHVSGDLMVGQIGDGADYMYISADGGAYPGADGTQFIFSGVYEGQ